MCLRGCAGSITLNSNVNLRAAIKRSFLELTLVLKDSALLAIAGFRALIRLFLQARLFGLRLGRILDWLAALQASEARAGFAGWWEMARLAARAVFRRRAAGAAVHEYWQCHRCPIFDREFRRCGAGDGLGCGCYVAYALAAGKPCWGRENVPGFEFGY